MGGLTASSVDCVPEVVAAPGRASSGRTPGSVVISPCPGSSPIVYRFPGVGSPTGAGLGVPIGSGRDPITPGAARSCSRRFSAGLLGQQRLDLLLGLTLALKELGQRCCDFFGCQDGDRLWIRLTGLLCDPLTSLWRHV